MPAGCQCVVFLETVFKEKCLGWAADHPASRTRRPLSDLLPRRQQLLHTLHLTPIPAPSPPPPWCCHRGNVTSCKFSDLFSITALWWHTIENTFMNVWLRSSLSARTSFNFWLQWRTVWIYQVVWQLKRSLVHCHEESMRRWLQTKPGYKQSFCVSSGWTSL